MKFNLLSGIRKITALLERLSPSLASKWASRLFFSPRETQRRAPNIPNLKHHWQPYTKTSGAQSKVKVYTCGTGPGIMLLHGWEGASFSHSVLANFLLEAGFRVVLFDMPAHGLSPHKKTNLIEVSDLIRAIAKKEGGISAIIGHSFGAASAGFAIQNGLSVNYFISIAAPTSIRFMIDRFCKIIGASSKLNQGLTKEIEDILQNHHETAALIELAPFGPRGLIVHDRGDQTVPYRYAKQLAEKWPDAEFMTTTGLGHSRILQSEQVAKAIISLLS